MITKRVFWTTLIWSITVVGYAFLYLYLSPRYSIWQSLAFIIIWITIAFINIRRSIHQSKVISLNGNLLVIKQSFQKEKQLLLSDIQSWDQHDYVTLGIQTGKKIILRLSEQSSVDIWHSDNKTEFGKLVDYLNEHLEEKYVAEK